VGIKAAAFRIGVVVAAAVTVVSGEANPGGSVKIGILTWTKKNINIETAGSWCYKDSASYCAKYGRLYTWEAAKKACESMGDGWRLPMNQDWDHLVFQAGDEKVAGKKLKSTRGWNNTKNGASGNGTDDFGFSALPGGISNSGDLTPHQKHECFLVGDIGYWWSASEYGTSYAYSWDMSRNYDAVYEGRSAKELGFSVRCVAGLLP
jgi:uncharacterized protein (TIGR02145 family)